MNDLLQYAVGPPVSHSAPKRYLVFVHCESPKEDQHAQAVGAVVHFRPRVSTSELSWVWMGVNGPDALGYDHFSTYLGL